MTCRTCGGSPPSIHATVTKTTTHEHFLTRDGGIYRRDDMPWYLCETEEVVAARCGICDRELMLRGTEAGFVRGDDEQMEEVL